MIRNDQTNKNTYRFNHYRFGSQRRNYFFSLATTKKKLHTLTGRAIPVLSRKHVPDNTKITYNSNPPTSGEHYALPQDAGIYVTPPQDGHLVHSMEHGAVILWYDPKKLTKDQQKQLRNIFLSMILTEPKIIMTPRKNFGAAIAVTSWGRMIKMDTIDEKKIKIFFTTNYDQSPEEADI